MFAARYFAPRYWAERYWPSVGAELIEGADCILALAAPLSDLPVVVTAALNNTLVIQSPMSDTVVLQSRLC